MTARPHLDDRDPQPPTEWRPVSHTWARKQALDACRDAVTAARDARTTDNRNAETEETT